jgi:hypothetical protein
VTPASQAAALAMANSHRSQSDIRQDVVRQNLTRLDEDLFVFQLFQSQTIFS